MPKNVLKRLFVRVCPLGCGRFPTPGIEPGILESGTTAMLTICLTYSVSKCLSGNSSSPVSSVGRAWNS